MNTSKRGKKNNDIVLQISDIWNNRLEKCMAKRGISRKEFAKAFKEEYGTGNITDVGRWLRVGDYSAKNEIIGFPSYDTMKRIADFFGVTVGYLTGETDFETFELERACAYLSIDKETGHAIERITKGTNSYSIERYLRYDRTAVFELLMKSDGFYELLGELCEYAYTLHRYNHPVDYVGDTCKNYDKNVLNMAWEYVDSVIMCCDDNEIAEFNLSPDVIEAIHTISEARDKAYHQPYVLEDSMKIEKYTLSEIFQKLVDEVINDETVDAVSWRGVEKINSVEEFKKRLVKDGSIKVNEK